MYSHNGIMEMHHGNGKIMENKQWDLMEMHLAKFSETAIRDLGEQEKVEKNGMEYKKHECPKQEEESLS